jgi:hypothetical protein
MNPSGEIVSSRMERVGAGGACWEQVHTSGPDQGCHIHCHHHVRVTSRVLPGAGKADPRSGRQWQDVCSAGEGKPPLLFSTTRVTHRIDPNRAQHARLWAVNVCGTDTILILFNLLRLLVFLSFVFEFYKLFIYIYIICFLRFIVSSQGFKK